MSPKKRIAAVAIAIIILAAILTRGFGLFDGRSDQLTLYGNVDIREVDMAFEARGRIATIDVEEGEQVKKGQLLATIDPKQIEDRLNQADAQIAEARANLERMKNGSRPQEITQASARNAAAQAKLADARADYERRKGLVEEGAISRDMWSQTETALRMAEAEAADASATLSLAETGARDEDIKAAQARFEAAQASRASAATDLSDTRLVSATDGTVVTRVTEPGAIVQPGETVLTLSIDRPMRVRAYVAETDLSRIASGMKVLVKVDGREEPYHGTIGYISPQAEFTPKSVETESLRTDLVYRLRIIVSDPDGGLRQGQPVTVEVSDAGKAEG